MTLRVLVADDHPDVRAGLLALIDAADGMTVVAEAGNGRDAVRLTRAHSPDVVVMDLAMPALDGAAATREILAMRPATGVVVLTMHADDAALAAALQAGALGFVVKDSIGADVLDAIRAVAAGTGYFAAALAPRVIRLASTGVRAAALVALPELTAREREVLALVADGLDNASVARRLTVSPLTVRNHMTNILAKLNVPDRQAAAEVARRAGLGASRRPGTPPR